MIKEKRYGNIKDRTYDDGRKQSGYISKEKVASPTIQIESLVLSLIIGTKEARNVATSDISGGHL